MFKALLFSFCFLVISGCATLVPAQNKFNGDFEITDSGSRPIGWTLGFNSEQQKAYKSTLDSNVKVNGKYSLRLEKVGEGSDFGAVDFSMPQTYQGKTITLTGMIKTENVKGGYAGFWLRIDGTPAFDNMNNQRITGTTDWKEYTITLPYDAEKATSIHAGGLLVGAGKVWMDNIRVLLDGKNIDEALIKPLVLSKAKQDSSFSKGSKIDTILLSKQQRVNLTLLGQVWGFLKYHHPLVAKGDLNFDAELFRVLPKVLNTKDNSSLSKVLEKWTDEFGVPAACKGCQTIQGKDVASLPDYGHLFDGSVLSPSFTGKLTFILNNRNSKEQYYIGKVPNVGNPIFTNEESYESMLYPDAGYRLLSLFRYWNMIQYYFPYKHLIGENWNEVLPRYLPKFIHAQSATDYALANLELIANVHDTHANIWSGNAALSAFRGKYSIPVQAKFIENKLTVTNYYSDTLDVKNKLKIGTVITAINGKKVEDLVKQFLPLSPASNYATQLRDLPLAFLLRSNDATFKLETRYGAVEKEILLAGMPFKMINFRIDESANPKGPGFFLMENHWLCISWEIQK
jgi:hypothetical protein